MEAKWPNHLQGSPACVRCAIGLRDPNQLLSINIFILRFKSSICSKQNTRVPEYFPNGKLTNDLAGLEGEWADGLERAPVAGKLLRRRFKGASTNSMPGLVEHLLSSSKIVFVEHGLSGHACFQKAQFHASGKCSMKRAPRQRIEEQLQGLFCAPIGGGLITNL